MKYSELQRTQIGWELETLRVRSDLMPKTFELGNARLSKLRNDESYLEMVLVHSQVIEHYIRHILNIYATQRRILKILGQYDPYAEIKLNIDDDEPLGPLIGTLTRFIGKTALIGELNRFNNELKREVAHHIFDGSKDVETFEQRIEEYFDRSDDGKFRVVVNGLRQVRKEANNKIKALVEDIKASKK